MIYITFGQCHTHRVNGYTFDKDCVALIRDRDRAFELFGDKWAFEYEKEPDMLFYPRGIREVESDA